MNSLNLAHAHAAPMKTYIAGDISRLASDEASIYGLSREARHPCFAWRVLHHLRDEEPARDLCFTICRSSMLLREVRALSVSESLAADLFLVHAQPSSRSQGRPSHAPGSSTTSALTRATVRASDASVSRQRSSAGTATVQAVRLRASYPLRLPERT